MELIHQQEILNALVDDIKPKIGEKDWRDWFTAIDVVYQDGYILNFPNQFVCEWVRNRYANEIRDAATKIGITLKFGIAKDFSSEITKTLISNTSQFNENFVFDKFIVAKSNEMAYEAAFRVAKSKKITFNPLFICGDVGVGKTHLMHAIANYRNIHFPDQRVMYLSAEQFMNMFVRAIQKKTVLDFKDEFRSVDVLLVDDFQFLGSKDATQEEFFHTFNALLENKKQLVISADKPPHCLPGVEARLKSRLGWGLVVDIHPANYELKLGILKSKCEYMNLKIDDAILSYIAQKVGGSIRELEGAFTRVIKYSEWMSQPITIELASQMLHGLSSNIRQKSAQEVLDLSCKFLELTLDQVQSANRSRPLARARQKIIYLMRAHTEVSYMQIAKMLGGKDHSSVIYAESQAKKLLQADADFAASMTSLKNAIGL